MNNSMKSLLSILIMIVVFGQSVLAQPNPQMVLIQGQSRVMQVKNLTRIAVGDETIVDVLALDTNQLLLNPLKTGITSLHLWSDKGQQIYQLRVVADDGTLTGELLSILDLPDVDAWFIDKHLVLEGQVTDEFEKERAEKIAAAYSDSVINLLHLPAAEFDRQLVEQTYRLIGKQMDVSMFNGTLILEGEVENEEQHQFVYRLAQVYNYPIIDLIQVKAEAQSKPEKQEVNVIHEIAQAIGTDIKVYAIGETVFLEGLVADEYQHTRALAIANAFNYPVIDLIRIQPQAAYEQENDAAQQERPFADSLINEDFIINLTELINNPAISLRLVYDHLILEGEVADSWEKERAVKLAEITEVKVIDLITIADESNEVTLSQNDQNVDDENKEEELNRLIADPNIQAKWINQTLILEGFVLDSYEKERALAIGRAFSNNVIDLILVHQPLVVDTLEPIKTEEDQDFKEEFYRELAEDLKKALKEPGIDICFYKDTLVLEGIVPNKKNKERAETIAELFYHPIISFIEIPEPGEINAANQLAAHVNLPDVEITLVGNSIVLEGTVQDQNEHSRVLEIASLYGEVIDLLTVCNPAQVLLQVHVVELNRDAGQQLGIKWGSLNENTFIPDIIQFEEVAHIGSWVMNRSFMLASQLEALEKEGKAKLLAAPSLLTLSGETASFLVGGEIPIVVTIGEEQLIEWREYGVKLDIAPLVFDDKVRVNINPEVSSLDWNNSIQFSNTKLPGLKTRKTSTTVTVEHGVTVVISGLIQHEELEYIEKVPILGDLPIIGLLFRSVEYQQNQTELVIFVTPWIIADEEVIR